MKPSLNGYLLDIVFLESRTAKKISIKMESCEFLIILDSRPELFKHTSLIDDDDNYYIDQNERLRTLIEIEEVCIH